MEQPAQQKPEGLLQEIARLHDRIKDLEKDVEFLSLPAQQEPVAFITPLMEQQMFDDWCPYKGNPDPRTVWAAAVDAVNGLLLGASPPAQRKPLTDEKILGILCIRLNEDDDIEDWRDEINGARAIEAAHDIKENT